MPYGWKYTRANGTDHYTGKVNYRENIGEWIEHPKPDKKSHNACGRGFHLGKTLRGAGSYGKPEAIFRCQYYKKDILGQDNDKVRVSKLKVIKEAPVYKGYGPRGKQFFKYIESLKEYDWFKNVGESIKKPKWTEKIKQVDSWLEAESAAWSVAWSAVDSAAGTAARSAAGAAARSAAWSVAWSAAVAAVNSVAWTAAGAAANSAAWSATEIIGGIKNGYFKKLMEIYKAGHWPISFDGKKLVVF